MRLNGPDQLDWSFMHPIYLHTYWLFVLRFAALLHSSILQWNICIKCFLLFPGSFVTPLPLHRPWAPTVVILAPGTTCSRRRNRPVKKIFPSSAWEPTCSRRRNRPVAVLLHSSILQWNICIKCFLLFPGSFVTPLPLHRPWAPTVVILVTAPHVVGGEIDLLPRYYTGERMCIILVNCLEE